MSFSFSDPSVHVVSLRRSPSRGKIVVALVALVGVLLMPACAPSRNISEPEPEPFALTLTRLALAFADSARANGVIGAQVAVSIPGQETWTDVFGEDSPGVPMQPDILLGTGSISKMLTAVAALRLVDRGLISFSDTLGHWFPGAMNLPADLQLRHLFWHQSGLPEYGAAANYASSVLADRNRTWTAQELLAFVGAPTFAPGTSWYASNTDRLLLATIGAMESGLSHGEYLRRELFADGTGEFWSPGQLSPTTPRIGTHWALNSAGVTVNYSDAVFGPSIFTSRVETYISARELVKFARRLFEGDFLSDAARTSLLTFVPEGGGVPGQTGAGIGLRRFSYGGRTMYGNSGATTNSSAMYLYDPGTGVIVSMNTNQAGALHRNSHFNVVPALMFEANRFVNSNSRAP